MKSLKISRKEAEKVTHDINNVWHARYRDVKIGYIYTHIHKVNSPSYVYVFRNYGFNNYESSGNTRLLTGGDEIDIMNMREKLASLPHSYDDFVRFTMQCIDQEDGVKEAIDNQFLMKPDSDTNDITKVVVDFLGLGEPFEIVDDD